MSSLYFSIVEFRFGELGRYTEKPSKKQAQIFVYRNAIVCERAATHSWSHLPTKIILLLSPDY